MASTTSGSAPVLISGAVNGIPLTIPEDSLLFASRGVMLHLGQPLFEQMGIVSPNSKPIKFLDLACGTGIMTDLVQKRLPREILERSSFKAVDAAEGMVKVAKRRSELEGWINVETDVMDAKQLALEDSSFSHVATALALHMIPEPDQVVRESMRILQPGGTFGATTWAAVNSTQWFIRDLRTAFASLPIDVPPLESLSMQTHEYGYWTDASWIESHLEELGLEDVIAREMPGTYRFESAGDWMTTFESMVSWMMNMKWSEQTRKKMPFAEVKERVIEHLKDKYDGGGWDVSWTTIVMTGRVPRA